MDTLGHVQDAVSKAVEYREAIIFNSQDSWKWRGGETLSWRSLVDSKLSVEIHFNRVFIGTGLLDWAVVGRTGECQHFVYRPKLQIHKGISK